MKIDKKYVMIVTAEDERYGTAGYGLDFFFYVSQISEIYTIVEEQGVKHVGETE